MKAMGEKDYRQGARDRISEAFVLLERASLGGCVYLAGRGVEGALRAVNWRSDPEIKAGRKSLDTGHDLRLLMKNASALGVFTDPARDDPMVAHV